MSKVEVNLCMALLTIVAVALTAGTANAATIYFEDFEGASLPATILDAPVSWTSALGTCDVPITQGSSPLNGTQVADGPSTTSGSNLAAAVHDITDSPSVGRIFTVSADVYFTNPGAGNRADCTFGLVDKDTTNGWTNDDGATVRGPTYGTASDSDFELVLDLTGIGGSNIGFGGGVGVNQAAALTIELDLINNVATGTIVDGSGTYSVSESISTEGITMAEGIDRLTMIQRGLGFDVDNILVTEEIPEPSTLMLFVVGLIGLTACMRRRK